MLNIKNNDETKVILCKNSYERRFVHILSNSLSLYHSRYGDWSDFFKKYSDKKTTDIDDKMDKDGEYPYYNISELIFVKFGDDAEKTISTPK